MCNISASVKAAPLMISGALNGLSGCLWYDEGTTKLLLEYLTSMKSYDKQNAQPMFCHGLCHWYFQPTPESYVIDTPADVSRRLDSYIVDTSADTGWAKDLRCIQRAIRCPIVWHSDRPVCMGVYCWTKRLCSVAFQCYNMHPCILCRP